MHADYAAPDHARRVWVTTVCITGVFGMVATSIPFVASMAPSERARALGAKQVDVGAIQPGELQTVAWRGKPV